MYLNKNTKSVTPSNATKTTSNKLFGNGPTYYQMANAGAQFKPMPVRVGHTQKSNMK